MAPREAGRVAAAPPRGTGQGRLPLGSYPNLDMPLTGTPVEMAGWRPERSNLVAALETGQMPER